MKKVKQFMQESCSAAYSKISTWKETVKRTVNNEQGEGILGALGWGVVVVTLVVAAHGLFTGWLPDFIQTKILDRINGL